MKQTLQLRLGQTLTMTPQLQQAIRLLQLSTLELQTEIQQALDSNPMLDVEDDNNEEPAADRENGSSEDFRTETASKENSVESTGDESLSMSSDNQDIPDELPVDSAWDDIYEPNYSGSGSGSDDSNRDFFELQGDHPESLQDHLLEQIHLKPLSDTDLAIAAALIDSVDDSGYLCDDLETILDGLNREREELGEEPLSMDEVEAVLCLVQSCDPPGIAARDLRESMLIQLNQIDPATPGLANARVLVDEQLDTLASRDFNKLKRTLKLDDAELQQAITVLQSLNPRPGSQLTNSSAQYIVPDVFVRKHKGVWRVELNPDIAPRLCINALYSSMVRRADKSDDNTFMRNHLQEARWFIKSLQSRNETLLKVATAIVKRQRGFLEYGEEAMKPMILRDVAEQLEMHESTISRVTTQKFMHTPRGIFEFKYFFSSHVSTADGGECSATAIRAMLKKLISEEDSRKPLSDSKIASILGEKGIQVARRTVAKYREAMAIPPSNERKRL